MSFRLDKITGLRWAVAALGLASLAVLAWRLIDGTGGDFQYFFPRMLDSYLFLRTNGLALEEYTASFCAGIFVFANPQTVSLSLPQVMLFVVDPLMSVRLTFVFFSALGGAGMYLASRRLDLEPEAALASGIVFVFTGYLITRMMVGQVAMQTFALTPLIAWMVMQGLHRYAAARRLASAAFLAGAAFVLAFTFYSGVAALLAQMGAIIGFMTLLYGLRQGAVIRAFVALAGVAVFSLMLAAPKFEAGLSVMEIYPKNYYDLPGFTPWGLLRFLVEGFFFNPSAQVLNELLIGRPFLVGWQMFYFGMTPFVFALLVAPLFWAPARRRLFANMAANRTVVIFAGVYALVPIAMNLLIPGWNEFLHSLPLLGQVNTMIRWALLLVPLVALLAGLSITYWDLPAVAKPVLAAGLIVGMTAFNMVMLTTETDEVRNYDSGEILKAWTLIHERDATPPRVTQIGMRLQRDDAGKLEPLLSPWMDHVFLQGASNAGCYEPIFGYRLERFPFGDLKPGGIGPPRPDGTLNLKNPACHVYPEANGCAPGDHFREEQIPLVADFLDRKPVEFATSARRQFADTVGAVALLLCACVIGTAAAASLLGWIRRRQPRQAV